VSRAGTRLERDDGEQFTAEDFAARIERAGEMAEAAGLSGVLVTPGPDLLYLTGYAPVAITERLTMLVVSAHQEPAMIVPVLERPDAESAPGSSKLTLSDWADGSDSYEAATQLLDRKGRYAISDAAWAMHVLGLQARLPETGYVSMTEALPMLRAVKDADELELLAAAGEAARRSVLRHPRRTLFRPQGVRCRDRPCGRTEGPRALRRRVHARPLRAGSGE
jgi:D-alanyl-D-alanine dipeptidase